MLYEEFVNDRGLTVVDLINYRNHPIDNVEEILKNKIPILLVCGDNDSLVPYEENGKVLYDIYEKNGGRITQIIKSGFGHHPHGLKNNDPLVSFTLKNY